VYTGAKGETVSQKDPFKLETVERCRPPFHGTSGAWCQYTISQGDTLISCYRRGSSTEVRDAATQIVAALNARRADRRGRTHIVLNSDKSKLKKGQ
jgi:hypothetical protein